MQATMEKKRLEQFKKQLEQRQQELRRVVSRTQEDGRIADAVTASLDASLAERELGWRAETSVADGLRLTLDSI